MRSLLLLCLCLPSLDEFDTARDGLNKGLSALERPTIDRMCTALVKLNDERTPGVFIAAFRAGLIQIAEMEKERLKVQKEMEKVEPVRDKEGRITKGDLNKWQVLRNEHDLWAGKIDILNGALPRIVSQMGKLSVVPALTAAMNATAEWYPRACCAEALGRIDKPEALAALLARARIEGEGGVRVAIADALASRTKTSDEARAALLPWLEGGIWEVRLAAAQALTQSGEKKLIPTLIRMLSGTTGRMNYEINECLKKLTGGVDKHGNSAAWSAWWEKNENEVLAGTYVPTLNDRGDGPGVTTFYGIPLHSTKVAFIIDVSLSMKDPSTWKPEITDGLDKLDGEKSIDVARYELRKILKKIPEGAAFVLIGMYGRLAMLSDKWTIATAGTREKAVKFVQALELKSGTDVHGALIRALDFSGGNWNTPPREDSIDTIFILSDGMSSVGLMDRGQIPDRIIDAARFKRIAITAIGVDAVREGRDTLKKISEGTGGVFVPR